MTNVIATISLVVVTNWVTTSVTRPVCDQPGCLVIHCDTEHQMGARVTNTVATIVWGGKTNQMVLESTRPFYEGDLKQDYLRSPYTGLTNWIR
jgi:hypothetical protein